MPKDETLRVHALLLAMLTFSCALACAGVGPREATPVLVQHADAETLRFGSAAADEWLGTGVVVGDATCVSANVSGGLDRFSDDLVVSCRTEAGKEWARVFTGPFRDRAPDAGQNAETGGTAASLVATTTRAGVPLLVAVAETSTAKTNNVFSVIVLGIEATSGELLWARSWAPDKAAIASNTAEPYSVAAGANGKLYVVGEMGDGTVLILTVGADGGFLGVGRLDVAAGVRDVGTAVAIGEGALLVGGISGGEAFAASLPIDGRGLPTSPRWIVSLPLGTGSRVNYAALELDGEALLSLDLRGVNTSVAVARMSRDGAIVWARGFAAEGTDRNNAHWVGVREGAACVAGRIGLQDLDRKQGDGFVAELDGRSGDFRWAKAYFSGAAPDTLAEHRVKSVVWRDGAPWAFLQAVTVESNTSRYTGEWRSLQDISKKLELATRPILSATFTQGPEGVWTELSGASAPWVEAPAHWRPVGDSGQPPDAEVVVTRVQ